MTICQAIHDSMQDNLTDICCMTSAMAALASYMEQEYSLVILDIQLSDVNSFELLRTMHHAKHTPILVLYEYSKTDERTAALQAGADACLEKPLNLEACVAQANALIQLYLTANINHEQHGPVIHGNELIILPRYRQVTIEGKPLELARKEFDLLYYFAKSPGQIFTREQLYNQIWGDGPAIAVDEAVRTQIKRLRRKLASVGKNYIQTEWGVGYKFILSN